jgi:queuine/archaeosine tRNA-ribosyltransferase
MAFDECTPDKADKKYTLEAMERNSSLGRKMFERT